MLAGREKEKVKALNHPVMERMERMLDMATKRLEELESVETD